MQYVVALLILIFFLHIFPLPLLVFQQNLQEKIRKEAYGDFSDVLSSIIERKSPSPKNQDEQGDPRASANVNS